MSAFLAGIPGQLKTLLDRLTSGRATNLDNLDATISSRAPSSTAVSNADYTSARAGKLDDIDAAITTRAPSSTALSTATWTSTRAGYLDNLTDLDAPISGIAGVPTPAATGWASTATTNATSFTTVATLTGAGTLLYLRLFADAATNSPVTAYVKVVADGVNVWGDDLHIQAYNRDGGSGASDFNDPYAMLHISPLIIFSTSCVIQARINDGINGESMMVTWAAMKTSV